MRLRSWGWAARSQVERVRLYTVGSLYVVTWFLLLVMLVSAVNLVSEPLDIAGMAVGTLALGVAATWALHAAVRLYPHHGPLPWRELGTLLVVAALCEAPVFLLPDKGRFAATLVVVGALAWGAGGLRDRTVQWTLYVASVLLVVLPTGNPGYALAGLAVALFLLFTVQSSLWLLGVVTELEGSRHTQAALAVAEERLRFSRDVHDVLGRELSTIAVQAELAATLAERGDPRAPRHILQVRETAHEALREARELARGYRPLDLHAEVDGAISLLRSAGITATADLSGLPTAWHEPVARVIREAVTNVLRHSTATHVEMTYADGAVLISNDGVITNNGSTDNGSTDNGSTDNGSTDNGSTSSGTGLSSLAEQLAPSGMAVTTDRQGETFVLRAELAARPVIPSGEHQ